MTKASGEFMRARRAILAAYERGASIDISLWVRRFPHLRNELLDYWLLLRGSPRSVREYTATWPDDDVRVV
jgi:hypothetical protein